MILLEWVKKESDKREIELYIACMFNTGYQSYKFDLDYSSIEIKKDTAMVSLTESNQVVHTSIAPQISKMGELPHRITLHLKNGVWVIYQDEYKDEFTDLFASSTIEEIRNQVDENYLANGENKLDNPEALKCQTIFH